MAKYYRGLKVSNGNTATYAVVHEWEGELLSVVGCRATRESASRLFHSEMKKFHAEWNRIDCLPERFVTTELWERKGKMVEFENTLTLVELENR